MSAKDGKQAPEPPQGWGWREATQQRGMTVAQGLRERPLLYDAKGQPLRRRIGFSAKAGEQDG